MIIAKIASNTNTAIFAVSPVSATDTGTAADAAVAWAEPDPGSAGSDSEWLWLEAFRAFSTV